MCASIADQQMLQIVVKKNPTEEFAKLPQLIGHLTADACFLVTGASENSWREDNR